MAWEIRDEWINLAEARHYVVFHNRDVLVEKTNGRALVMVPAEHHLIHEFKLQACPHCGVPKVVDGEPVDFAKTKAETLAKLNAHHGTLMNYRAQHPKVRVGSGPKP